MDFKVTTPATTSVVSVADLKTHLLLFGDDAYDAELQAILLTAEGFISDFIGEYISTTSLLVNIADFSDFHFTHKDPTSVVVSYWDSNNTAQTLSADNYTVDASGEYLRIIFDTKPSDLTSVLTNQGYITYTTTMSVVTPKLKHAVLLVAAELFENRTNSVTGVSIAKLPLSAMRLIQTLRGW
jgi:uncharacterized phiE125 gp8 family phage protein